MRRFLLVCLFCFNYQVVSCLVNECLIRVLDDSNGLIITTLLKSGHEQTYTFPELHLACTSINYRCQELAILDPATANSTEAISAAMVDNGILLLKFFYLDLEQPIVELISNFTLDLGLNCMPLALMTNDFFPSDYLIACATNDYEFQLRQLFINKTNIEASWTTRLFRANDLIIFTGGNFSLLSNFIQKSNVDKQIFFAYRSTVYEIHIDIQKVSVLGLLHNPDQFNCDFARRLAFDQTDNEIIFADCPNAFVQFSITRMRWVHAVVGFEPRDLLCPRESATLFPANSTVNYQNRNIQLPGLRPRGNGECFGELDQQYFVYEGFGSSIWLADLAKDAVTKLSNNPCGSDQIFVIDNRYVAVTESGNQECSTKLYDTRSHDTMSTPLIISTGPYSTLGVVDWFIQTRSTGRDENNAQLLPLFVIIPLFVIFAIMLLVGISLFLYVKRSRSEDNPRRKRSNISGTGEDPHVQLQSISTTDISRKNPVSKTASETSSIDSLPGTTTFSEPPNGPKGGERNYGEGDSVDCEADIHPPENEIAIVTGTSPINSNSSSRSMSLNP